MSNSLSRVIDGSKAASNFWFEELSKKTKMEKFYRLQGAFYPVTDSRSSSHQALGRISEEKVSSLNTWVQNRVSNSSPNSNVVSYFIYADLILVPLDYGKEPIFIISDTARRSLYDK